MRYALVFAIAFVLLAGCGDRDASPPSQGAEQENQVKLQQTDPGLPAKKDAKEIARHLEELAMSVPKVKAANCVVFRDKAIVGIDVAEDLDRAHVGTVKYSVAEALRNDPYGADAIVTADVDMAARIREIRGDIRRGRTVNGFAEELADIMGRIIPQLPKDTAPKYEPNPSEDAKQLPHKSM